MSFAGASAHVCGKLDPVNHTCITSNTFAQRSLSLPVKRHSPFSSPQRSGSCVLASSQARPVASVAAVLADKERADQRDSGSSSSVQDRLRQLEASYKASSAAELEHIQLQSQLSDTPSDKEGTFTKLERSWQAQAEASTSGRSSASDSTATFIARLCAKGSNNRSKRRSSRLYAASTRRNHAQNQGVAAPEIDGCPDTVFCAAIRDRLKTEKHQHRISRSLAESSAVSMFLYDLGDSSILTREEEGRLSEIYQKGTSLEAVTASLKEQLQREPTSAELADALTGSLHGLPEQQLHQVRVNMEEARQLMVQFNLRLVVSICRKYLGQGVEIADLIPEGISGMSRAIEKFDASKGFKFSTYAHWWIRQSVARCIANQSQVIRVPVHVYDLVNKIKKKRRAMMEDSNRASPPSHEEIGAELGITGKKVWALLKQASPAVSLEGPAYATPGAKTEKELALMDVIAVEPQDDEPRNTKAKDDVNTLLSTLLPRERNVIRMRYGLHDADGTCMTFNDIGAAYGLSKERVRQIEDKALTKLRSPGRAKLLQNSSSR